MGFWAWHSLWRQRAQLLGHVAGIAGAFLLALFFDAVFRGESQQIVSYPRHVQPDVWVMQKGVALRGEAVIPTVLARLTGITLGDTVHLTGRPFVVVGLSEGTYSWPIR